ncbi:MAG: hypothetical protein ACE14T_11525 [Syntrophales bacterium]
MIKKDKGSYSAKYPAGRKTDPSIEKAVKERARDRVLPCAVAVGIAADLNIAPAEVGFTMDRLEISITKCQLGLFGNIPIGKIVKPAEEVDRELKDAITSALVDNRLPCAAAWDIAKRLRITKIKVSSACEALKVKISKCQLGAF